MEKYSTFGQYLDLYLNFTLLESTSTTTPNPFDNEPITPSHLILSSTKKNLNTYRDVEKPNNQKTIVYLRRSKLKNKENFTLEVPRVLEPMIDPNI